MEGLESNYARAMFPAHFISNIKLFYANDFSTLMLTRLVLDKHLRRKVQPAVLLV
jgi:hypothetical protein